ncbi:4,5-dihydroxyphthalate dehydrogenase [Sorangium cellulosum]|uniref:4,5-dihydroxyphthalate dehydrogenase n=1 Tax=Sorangium cellulosum TaxID=56 RepID=A0A2L0F430_SORCE|nr:Gfo/Idh/MocA family oxidoreductase [Sorangium cellulosum]AUX46312.1 4,5-dihydroxyphthalate dehydrogenase [Sorangium cellulosum]
MMKKYGVGILGAGWVAGEYLKAFHDHPLTEVVGMASRTPGKAARLMRERGVEGREYGSLDELFNDDRVAIVVSATHADVRAEHCERAARTGRHLVIEKPAGLSHAETDRIREAVARAGVKSVTSFVLRWNPQFVTVRQMIQDGVLGDLVYAEGDYWHPLKKIYTGYPSYVSAEIGRSAFITAGCHAVDIVRYLGGEIVEVAAFSTKPRLNPDYQYDPNVVAMVRFANGAVGKLSTVLDADTPYIFNCRLFGTGGTLQNNAVYSSKRYPGARGYWSFPTIQPDSADVTHHPFVDQIAHFVECIEGNVESHASIHDAWRSMAVCYAIDESLAKGGHPVRVRSD